MGNFMAAKLSKRVFELELSLKLLEKMRIYIYYRQTPTVELIGEMAELDIFEPLYFITECNARLKTSSNFTLEWKTALDNNRKKINLTNDDINQLADIGDYLGGSDVSGQISSLQLTESIIKQNLKDAKGINNKKGKMYRSLGFLLGAGISIFLF